MFLRLRAVFVFTAPQFVRLLENIYQAVSKAVGKSVEAVKGNDEKAAQEVLALKGEVNRSISQVFERQAERLAIAAHLGKGTGRLEQVLEGLDQAVAALLERPDPGGALLSQWNAALALSARRLEAAWIDLEKAVVREQQRWAVEIDNVRRWRRPKWPMWVATLALAATAVYLGLVFGGFMEPPPVLRPMAEFFWEHL